ncbi:ABC transporter ATP-binding protein [Neptunomonas sp. XY-337]|uniref:dipeptide ABC transporter ATP-binding protein n=1 Tax=Neptunomonas sp. XY-337 TaxID=2561897 RepID=UPI0010AA7FA9|nr:ABC transporter ATP-binding protein [Neptunomonas sp. XY-337]
MTASVTNRNKLLDINNLTIDFRTDEGLIRAVDDVSLSVREGEVMGLVGESGSGKSATAKAIMRLHPGNTIFQKPSQINFYHNDQAHSILTLRERKLNLVRGEQVSMIFQEPMASFAPAITLGEQMIETMQIHRRIDRATARKEGIALFDRVGIPMPDKRFDQYVFELSGGMRQRAMIAMALSTQPKLLIADEPTTALDVTIQAQVLELMLELREQMGMAMIFITHDLGVIGKVADNVTVMQRGRVVEAGAMEQVIYHPQHEYTQRLLNSLPHLSTLSDVKTDTLEPFLTVSHAQIQYPAAGAKRNGEAFTAVKDISLTLPKGKIIGLVGESGSGKTSLGKAMLGAVPLSHGEITFHGEHPLKLQAKGKIPRREIAARGQMVFQDPYSSLNPRMTVRDIIAEPLEAMGLTKNKAETDARVIEIAKLCKLNIDHLRRFPHAFSGGQRQRISIARALVCNPQFLVADESVAALDVSIQAEILNLLKSLRDELNLTILFISHDLSVIANLCDWVCVMKQGELIEEGSVRKIFLDPQAPYTQRLIGAIPLLDQKKLDAACEPLNTLSTAAPAQPQGCLQSRYRVING